MNVERYAIVIVNYGTRAYARCMASCEARYRACLSPWCKGDEGYEWERPFSGAL